MKVTINLKKHTFDAITLLANEQSLKSTSYIKFILELWVYYCLIKEQDSKQDITLKEI